MLMFPLFEQREIGIAYKRFAKRRSKGSFGDEDV
jgi:hypothetical protein